jgi:eukaryotic-like serine/threonine-protein kinase
MPLTAGAHLGPYEILGAFGVGGMGEVYRARDTKLDRDVAIKVLPESVAADPERIARFEREAKTLAALNHPHIAHIHGLEEANPSTGSGHVVRALVMELVEGSTLADRIGSGPLPLDEALRIAKQIADALEAAHAAGIVHRDLKPANIKVRSDGTVKVLDFGLAKALAPDNASGRVDAANSPTITSPAMTQAGIILGTAAYMAPEQARGRAVDKRADIWAFGCVLYEMLSGHAAFSGPTVTDTIAAVIERQPDWTALPAKTPPVVIRLLRRCLEKDVRRRLHDIADARLDLEDAENESPAALTDAPTRARLRLPWVTAAACALAGIATIAAVWAFTRSGHAPTPEALRFTIALQAGEELPMDAGLPPPVAISRDGRSIVYVTRRSSGNRIYLRRRYDIDGKPIAGTEGGIAPFVSPDGQWLGFASGGFLRKVPLEGGTPQNIAPVSNMFRATWSDNGWIVFHTWSGGLFKVEATGGTPSELTRVGDGEGHQVPYALPGGRSVLFAVFQAGTAPAIELLDLPAGTRKRLLEGSDPHYLSTGHLVFTRAGRLYTAPFDLKRLEVTGPATPAPGEIAVAIVQGRGALAIAESGTIVYVPATSTAGRLVLVDTTGSVRSAGEGFDRFRHPRFSSDGTRFVTWVESESGISELWVYDLERKTRLRLTVNGVASRPIWSHDDRNIAFQKDGSIYTMPADDSGPARILLARDSQAAFPLAWSRARRTLVYSRPSPQTNRDVYVLPEGGKPMPFLATPRDERSAMLSPDGQWMVYAVLEPGREEEVYVQPYPSPGNRTPISVGGGREPVWSPAGDEIFYRSIDGQRMMSVTVRTQPTFSAGRPRVIFQGLFRQGTFWSEYDVHPKTRDFLMVAVDEPTQPRLAVAVNWMASQDGR